VNSDFDDSDLAQEVGDAEMDDVYEQEDQQSDIGDQQKDMEEEKQPEMDEDQQSDMGDQQEDMEDEQQPEMDEDQQRDIGDQQEDMEEDQQPEMDEEKLDVEEGRKADSEKDQQSDIEDDWEADMEKKQQSDIDAINWHFHTRPDQQPDIPDQQPDIPDRQPRLEDDHPSDMEEEDQQLGFQYYQAHPEHAQRHVLDRAPNNKHLLVFHIDDDDKHDVQNNHNLQLEVLESKIQKMRDMIARRPSVNKLELTCFLIENTNALCIERCDESSCDRNTSNEFRTLLLDRCASTGLPPSSSSSGSSSGASGASGALLDYYCMGIQHISMICFTYSATIFGYCINF
jgi:hypothetical protein